MNQPPEVLQKSFAVSLLLALLVLFCVMISGFFGALVVAAASALMLYPLQLRLEKRFNPTVSASINLLFLVLAIIVPAVIILGMAAGQALAFVDQASSWVGNRLNSDSPFLLFDIPDWIPFEDWLEELKQEFSSKIAQIVGTAGRFVVGALSQVTQATALFLLDVFVVAYVFFYCVLSGSRLARQVMQSMPLEEVDQRRFMDVGVTVTRSVLRSMLVIGAVQGFFSGLAFYLIGIDGPIFWGIVMGFLSVIPFIGPVIIWLPVAIYLAVGGSYWQAIFLAGWFWVFVASIDNVLRPRLIGTETRMPDVLVLLTTLGGLFMFGAVGLIVGPLVGAFLMAAWEVYRRVFSAEHGGFVDLSESSTGSEADAQPDTVVPDTGQDSGSAAPSA